MIDKIKTEPNHLAAIEAKIIVDRFFNLLGNYKQMNYNCPDDEKIGEGLGSCGGGNKQQKKRERDILGLWSNPDSNHVDHIYKILESPTYAKEISSKYGEHTSEELKEIVKKSLDQYSKEGFERVLGEVRGKYDASNFMKKYGKHWK